MAGQSKIIIQLSSSDLDESRLQKLTRDMATTLRHQRLGSVSLNEGTGSPGQKGDPITIANIIMSFIAAGGVATSLVEVFRAYVVRLKSLKLRLSRPDGKHLSLDGTNFTENDFEATHRIIDDFLRG
jgi:hypothetical protein